MLEIVPRTSETPIVKHHIVSAPTISLFDQLTNGNQKNLPFCDEKKLLDTRLEAKTNGANAWRVEVICDAELVRRNQIADGRGRRNLNGKGIKAAVKQRAEELKCSRSLIWLHVRLFNNFLKDGLPQYSNLDEKGFFRAALQAPKPNRAIRTFAKFKDENEQFRVTDAWRWVQEKKRQQKTLLRTGKITTEAIIDHLNQTVAHLQRLKKTCPHPKITVRLFDPLIEEVRDQINDQLDKIARSQLKKVILAEPHKPFSKVVLAAQTGMSLRVVKHAMDQLEDKGVVYVVSRDNWQAVKRVTIEAEKRLDNETETY